MHVAVVSSRPVAALARATARHAAALAGVAVHVLDADGWYVPVGDERVLRPADLGIADDELHRLAAAHRPEHLPGLLAPRLARTTLLTVADGGWDALIAVAPGVLLLSDPAPLAAAVAGRGFAVALRTMGAPDDGRAPGPVALRTAGTCNPDLVVLATGASMLIDAWQAGADDPRWLDVAVLTMPGARVLGRPELVLSAGSLRADQAVTADPSGALLLDGEPVVALDLSPLDPSRPWWWADDPASDVRGRLSEHPALAAFVAEVARQARTDEATAVPDTPPADLTTTSLHVALDEPLRLLYSDDDGTAPDPFDPATADALLRWLVEPPATGGPGRYLRALLAARPDLRAAFSAVPGPGERHFRKWLTRFAADEGYPAAVLDPAARAAWPPALRPARPAPGLDVVGFLDGELGIGESARLVVRALDAAGIPHAEHGVDLLLASPRRAPARRTAASGPFDTALLCVNADLTPQVAATAPHLLADRYRIGMWYWEVEAFPPAQHGGFAALDEVWVATDFVRAAVEPHSPVPVVTLTPPLPQRGPEPTLTRDDLGLPDGPLLLFSYDHLSTLERKNPLGLVEAFSRAFAPGEGPTLVLKSINAHLRPADAERVRLAAARRPDVLLVERYLAPDERDALVAACDGYVSLHRSEGLGLTIAEAMAWGKPVVATAYGGNLQFMTEENSFLLPWSPAPIGPDAAPYPADGTWADPDLDAAAAALRALLDDPAEAQARGERAAADIATRHGAAVAGAAIAARLAALGPQRRRRSSFGARTLRRARAAVRSRF